MDLALKLSCSEKQTLFRLKFVPGDIVYIKGEVDGLRSAIFISGIIYYKEGVFAPCTELIYLLYFCITMYISLGSVSVKPLYKFILGHEVYKSHM